MAKENKKKGHGCLTTILIIVFFFILIGIIGGNNGNKEREIENDNKTEETSDDPNSTEEASDDSNGADEASDDSSEPLTLEEELRADIISVVGEDMLETFNYVPTENFMLIKFKGSENLTKSLTIGGMYMDITNIIKKIQDKTDYSIDFNVTYPLVDTFGNTSEPIVIKCTFTNETIKNINFDNFDYNNIPVIADEWWNHNALNLE